MASPVFRSLSCSWSLHSFLSWIPAAEWMQLSMQLCKGAQQPKPWALAALTIASTFIRVMSPCQSSKPSPSSFTTPLSSACCFNSASCILRKSAEISFGAQTFMRARISRCFSWSEDGIRWLTCSFAISSRMIAFRFSNLSILSFSFAGCKITVFFRVLQEGTFWCHSYQKVGIVMLSGFAENDFNFD